MKNKLILLSILTLLFTAFKFVAENTDDCIVKIKSEWGSVCEKCVNYKGNYRDYSDTYKVYLKNTCNEKIEVKCCVQESDKSWHCFPEKVLNPNDTLVAYACKSENGKFLKWTRKAGDREIVFPTDKEVNDKYKD
jgi:hypothetical protein